MTHAHDHTKTHHSDPYLAPLIWISVFAAVELAGGFWTKSLALLGDAGHMSTDMLALGLAMLAHRRARRIDVRRHASGHAHVELYASVMNAALMMTVVALIVVEAFERLEQPRQIAGGPVMIIAMIGLMVNVIVARKMHKDEHHLHGQQDLNHRAAFLHVLSDLLGSIAAVTAGAVIYFTGWMAIDPILSLFISVLILFATMSLIRDIWLAVRQHTHDTAV